MTIAKETIDAIIARNDIVDVIREYIPLQKAGRSFLGICPFHNDTNPSLHVSADKQIFKCFSCGTGGNVIKFVQEYEQISFVEACQKLAERVGIEMPKQEVKKDVLRTYHTEELKTLKLANDYAVYMLQSTAGSKALEYLRSERTIDPSQARALSLGYIPSSEDFIKFMKAKGISEMHLRDAGLVYPRADGKLYCFMEGRVSFPISSPNGDVIGFSCRRIGEQGAKYLNSPESDVFVKGNTLYRFDKVAQAARNAREVILMEGQMNVVRASLNGVENCVAQMGTALTDTQIRLLRSLRVPVKLMYDGDTAGQEATLKNARLLKDAGIETRAVLLPDGLDPDELILKDKDAFLRLCSAKDSILDYQLALPLDQSDFRGREEYAINFMKTLLKENDPLAEDHYMSKLAEKSHFSLESLQRKYQQMKGAYKQPFKIAQRASQRYRKNDAGALDKQQPKKFVKINLKVKKPNYREEVEKNFDRLHKDGKVMAFDENKIFERKDVLKKYMERKGVCLETTVTLINYTQDEVKCQSQGLAAAIVNTVAQHQGIPPSNLDYIAYVHTDSKHPHMHIQMLQKQTYLDQYRLNNKLIEQMEQAIHARNTQLQENAPAFNEEPQVPLPTAPITI